VARELRRGYTWRGRVIRFAEVQAVRGSWRSPSEPDDEVADELEPDEHDVETEAEEDSGPADDSSIGPVQRGPIEG
jgi:hypothetical protein